MAIKQIGKPSIPNGEVLESLSKLTKEDLEAIKNTAEIKKEVAELGSEVGQLKENQTTIADIERAMQTLPDGQAVSAQVALNTQKVGELDEDINGRDVSLDGSDLSSTYTWYMADGTKRTFGGTRKQTNVFDVKEGEVYAYELSGLGDGYATIVPFDKDGVVVVAELKVLASPLYAPLKGDYTISVGVKKLQVFNSNSIPELFRFYLKEPSVGMAGIVEELQEKSKEQNARIEKIENDGVLVKSMYNEEVDLSHLLTLDGTSITSQGTAVKNQYTENYIATDFFDVRGCHSMVANLMQGGSGGVAFYDKDKNVLTSYFGVETKNVTTSIVGKNKWFFIPKEAIYARASVDKTEQLNLKVRSKKDLTLDEYVSESSFHVRRSNTLWGFKEFGLSKARHTLIQPSLDLSAKQIMAKVMPYLLRMELRVAFVPKENSYIGIGFYDDGFSTNELKVNGNIFSIHVISGANDVNVEETTLPFSVEVGKTYFVGIKKTDGSTRDSAATYYIKGTSGEYYEKTISCADAKLGGISASEYSTMAGFPYFSLKKGAVEIVDICLASDYSPNAKVVICGDSYTTANTIYNKENRCAIKIANEIGIDDVVLCARGGLGPSASLLGIVQNAVRCFTPDYLILAQGANGTNPQISIRSISEIVEWAKSANTKVVLVTANPYGSGGVDDSRKEYRITYNDYIKNSGELYVDMCAAIANIAADGTATWKDGIVNADRVHPNEAGHEVIFQAYKRDVPEIFM